MLSNRVLAVGNAREDAGYEQFRNALSAQTVVKLRTLRRLLNCRPPVYLCSTCRGFSFNASLP